MASFKQNTFDYKSLDDGKVWDTPNKSTAVIEGLLKALYERIVVLEQQSREKDARIEKLKQEMLKASLANDVHVRARYCGGVLVWKIPQFQAKVKAMRSDHNKMYYSDETYTSPHGYRYCARVNISPKMRDYIALHIHFMRSDNDFHLDWVSTIHK